ncbi:MAG: substrate-binding domain-containing protein [Chloroflexota bacterium]|nr:substrate-binding domain-containing protein [Chloroflexota bacterium]
MRTLIVLFVGVLIGAAALGGVWAVEQGTEDEQLEVRVAVKRLDDGRVEIGVQQRERDGAWGHTQRPEHRFLLPDAETGKVKYSSAVAFDLTTRAERIADAYRAELVRNGQLYGEYLVRRFHAEDDPESLPPVLCLIDPREAALGALCDGVGETFPTGVEVIESGDYNAVADEVERRLRAGEISQILATSNQVLETAVFARDHVLVNNPDLDWTWVHYWFEPLDPQLPANDDLFCVIGHGGRDLFWGVASDTALVAATALGINLRSQTFSEVADQAEAIRQCVEDGAVSIATTLVSPADLAPAIAEATAAGIPVMSFNSGTQAAADVGSSFHIGLNDRRAGEIAGEQFNREGTQGTILCLIHESNNIGLHERCEGLAATYANGEVETWDYSGRNAEDAVLERAAEGDIAAVMALSDSVGLDVLLAQWPDPEVPLATFGFNLGFAKWVEEGKIMFAVYDHPLVQTYLSVMGALLIDRMRLDPVTLFNGMAMLIEPQIADAEQMRRVTNALIPQEIQDRYLDDSVDDGESDDSGDGNGSQNGDS